MKKLLNLELRIAYLEKKIQALQLYNENYMTIKTTDQRDYIVRTKYIGKLKDKNLIKDFKKVIEETVRLLHSFCKTDKLFFHFIGEYITPIASYVIK